MKVTAPLFIVVTPFDGLIIALLPGFAVSVTDLPLTESPVPSFSVTMMAPVVPSAGNSREVAENGCPTGRALERYIRCAGHSGTLAGEQ